MFLLLGHETNDKYSKLVNKPFKDEVQTAEILDETTDYIEKMDAVERDRFLKQFSIVL